jgi:hypothetical protein
MSDDRGLENQLNPVTSQVLCPYCGETLVAVPMNPSYDGAGFITECQNHRCICRRVFATPAAALEAAARRPSSPDPVYPGARNLGSDPTIDATAPPVRDLTEEELHSVINQVWVDVGLPDRGDDRQREDWIIRLTVKHALAILRGKP